jgi:hypothetical protein
MKELLAQNEGRIDRIVRVLVGILGVSLVFIGPKTAWGWIGLIPLVTGLVGMCPIYRILGVSSCGSEECEPS